MVLKIEVLNTYITKSGATAYKVKVNGIEHNATARVDSDSSYIINFKAELKEVTGRTNLTLRADLLKVGAVIEHDLTATATATARSPRVTLTNGHRTFVSLTEDGLAVEYGAYNGRSAVVVGSTADSAIVDAFKLVSKIKAYIADHLDAETLVSFNSSRVAVAKAESLRGTFDDAIVDDLVAKATATAPAVSDLLKDLLQLLYIK